MEAAKCEEATHSKGLCLHASGYLDKVAEAHVAWITRELGRQLGQLGATCRE